MAHKYIANTKQDVKEMLDKIGVNSIDDLFKEIPESVLMNREYNLEEGYSELEIHKHIAELAKKNQSIDDLVCFIGAGAYDHYIPSTIKHVISRNEFYTAYTPYQPEIAQGTLQYIFEWQTMITDLTDMDITNASMYDGPTATAEAMFMACSQARKDKILVSDLLNKNIINVIKTYAHFREIEIVFVKSKDGLLDRNDFNEKIQTKEYAGLIVQNPNFYGLIEDFEEISNELHDNKAYLIMNVNPMSLPVIKTPGEMGADIVAGDAQVFGLNINYGGPYVGFLATNEKLVRKLPGRICGQTKDLDGKRAFVLTLQAREQHIRREKATSNICSNQSLMALAATVYMATLGQEGLKDVATRNVQAAHYLANEINKLDKFNLEYKAPFFNEFVINSEIPFEKIKKACYDKGILPGYHLGENKILIAVTEKRSKKEMDLFLDTLRGL